MTKFKKLRLLFDFALAFHSLNKIGGGSAKTKFKKLCFLFDFALAFHYLCMSLKKLYVPKA